MIDLFFRFDDSDAAEYQAFADILQAATAPLPAVLERKQFGMVLVGKLYDEVITDTDENGEIIVIGGGDALPGLHLNITVENEAAALEIGEHEACLGATDRNGNVIFGTPPSNPRFAWQKI